jgi:neurofibromin 1
MTDINDVFLPAIPPSKKVSNEGEIHITHDGGKSTMVLVVPNREDVYKVKLN